MFTRMSIIRDKPFLKECSAVTDMNHAFVEIVQQEQRS